MNDKENGDISNIIHPPENSKMIQGGGSTIAGQDAVKEILRALSDLPNMPRPPQSTYFEANSATKTAQPFTKPIVAVEFSLNPINDRIFCILLVQLADLILLPLT